ncbi:MAG: hypothetical protein ACLP1X_29410 [Polyangiaceae bacterium]
MTASGTIAKLEALLARVRSRTAEPRTTRAAAPVLELSVDPPLDEEDDQPTLPPPPIAEVVQPSVLPLDIDVTVEETNVPVLALDPPAAQSPESRERLLAALPGSEPVAEELSSAEAGAGMDVAPALQKGAEEAVEEEPPASSRRPVVPEPEERLAEMAFGAEEPSPPRHSPPPESGRLPAAAAASFDDTDVTSADVQPPARDLVPEAIRGDVSANARVADVIGEAQRFAPSTFGALLDASLAL